VHKISTISKKDFPSLLREIPDSPELLYIQGAKIDEQRKHLAVVGSRANTQYGREVCETLIASLSKYPVTIVSGLALGIDGIAHRCAIQNNIPTIAIPGSGLDPQVLYPRSHLRLSEEILESGGTLLSEFEPTFRATPWSFPQRNRIMAGISQAILVIEASKQSGTLITAKYASDYNRDVLVVPGNIFNKTSEGPHLFMKIGATPITCENDLIEALGFKPNQKEIPFEEKYADCSTEEMIIVNILTEPIEKDELLRALKMPIHKSQSILSMMEIKGLIKEIGGEVYLLCEICNIISDTLLAFELASSH